MVIGAFIKSKYSVCFHHTLCSSNNLYDTIDIGAIEHYPFNILLNIKFQVIVSELG